MIINFDDLAVQEYIKYAKQITNQQNTTGRNGTDKLSTPFTLDRQTFVNQNERFYRLTSVDESSNKATVQSHWTKVPILATPISPHRGHFQLLLPFWHCNDNSKEPAHEPQRDGLCKIRPVQTELVYTFIPHTASQSNMQ